MYRLWTNLVVLCFFVFLFAGAASAALPPEVVGDAAVLMDPQNGQVLYKKNEHKPMYPASTTKILTAIIALEYSRLDEVATVPREATLVEGSAIGLQEGERLTMEDLLYAILLASANDAAVAVAHHVAGSVPAFAALMNEKARMLGAKESHFINPNGLPDPQHYTTAYDLALIARYAMENPAFRAMVATRIRQIHRPDADRSKGPPQEHLWNHNRLLTRYDGAIGVKTGYTVEAGQCIVSAAKRDGRELIAVLLNSEGAAIYSDAKALFDYGFSSFEPVLLVQKGDRISTFPVSGGDKKAVALTGTSFYFNFSPGEQPAIQKKILLREDLRAPLAAGQSIGELLLFDSRGVELGRVDLVAGEPVNTKLTRRWSTWAIGLVVFLAALRLLARALRRRRRLRVRLRNPRYLR